METKCNVHYGVYNASPWVYSCTSNTLTPYLSAAFTASHQGVAPLCYDTSGTRNVMLSAPLLSVLSFIRPLPPTTCRYTPLTLAPNPTGRTVSWDITQRCTSAERQPRDDIQQRNHGRNVYEVAHVVARSEVGGLSAALPSS